MYAREVVWKGYLLTKPINHLIHPFNYPIPPSDAYLLGYGLGTTNDVGLGGDGEGGGRRHHRLRRSEGPLRRRGLVQQCWTPTRYSRHLCCCVGGTSQGATIPRWKARSQFVGEVALPMVGNVPLSLDEGLQVKLMAIGIDHHRHQCEVVMGGGCRTSLPLARFGQEKGDKNIRVVCRNR